MLGRIRLPDPGSTRLISYFLLSSACLSLGVVPCRGQVRAGAELNDRPFYRASFVGQPSETEDGHTTPGHKVIPRGTILT